MKNKKLTYVSADFFFDVDFPVLKGLSKHYLIEWIAIFPIVNPRFSVNYLKQFCDKNHIKLTVLKRKYAKYHLLNIWFSLKINIRIIKSKATYIYIEDLSDLMFSFLSIFLINKNRTTIAIHDVIPHNRSKGYFKQKLVFFISKNFFINFHFFSVEQKKLAKLNFQKNFFITPLMLKDYGQSQVKKNSDCIQFLFFGRIEYYKGLDLLIDAVNDLDSDNAVNKFIITIAGNTNEWSQYENQINDKSIYDLKIEFVENKHVPDLFCSSHFLVLPYRDVTQSGPLAIAMRYNVPVIAPDHEGFKEIVKHKINGFLYDKYNEAGLKKTLEEIVNNSNFSNDYIEICQNLKKTVDNEYTELEVIKAYSSFFKSMS